MKITKVHIDRFRGFHNQEFEVGSQLTAIAGQNGTQKSTLLGMITQTFTISKDNPMSGAKLCVEEPIDLLLVKNSVFHQHLTDLKNTSGLYFLTMIKNLR